MDTQSKVLIEELLLLSQETINVEDFIEKLKPLHTTLAADEKYQQFLSSFTEEGSVGNMSWEEFQQKVYALDEADKIKV